MGDKGNMGSSISIQEQSKSPLSRACSRCPFHLFRAHWPPTAHVQCRLSCTKKSFQIQERRCSSLPTKLPSCSPTGLFKNRSSKHTDSQKTKPCAVCSGTEKEVNPGLSLVMMLLAFGQLCLLSPGSSQFQRTCSLFLLSVLSLRCPGASFGTFSNPVLNITITANRICFHYPINEAQKNYIL